MNVNDLAKTVQVIGAPLRKRRTELEQAMATPALFLVLVGAVAAGTIAALTSRFGATLVTIANQLSSSD